jgi:hypothetical protein
VTGCTFTPNNDSLLVSCGSDGLLACTDRRTGQVRCLAGVSTASQQYITDGYSAVRVSHVLDDACGLPELAGVVIIWLS